MKSKKAAKLDKISNDQSRQEAEKQVAIETSAAMETSADLEAAGDTVKPEVTNSKLFCFVPFCLVAFCLVYVTVYEPSKCYSQ